MVLTFAPSLPLPLDEPPEPALMAMPSLPLRPKAGPGVCAFAAAAVELLGAAVAAAVTVPPAATAVDTLPPTLLPAATLPLAATLLPAAALPPTLVSLLLGREVPLSSWKKRHSSPWLITWHEGQGKTGKSGVGAMLEDVLRVELRARKGGVGAVLEDKLFEN